jgi:cytochrome b561
MAVHQTFLPETDGAKHALFFGLLNPFVLMIAIPIAGLAGLVACPFAIFLLLRTRLEISIPVVFVSTVAGAAIGAAVHVFIAALSGLAIGGGAMMVCNLIFHEGRGRARPA